MMALINNWDLKEVNNAIYDEKGEGPRYVVSDLGASFGETGNAITRSKSNPGDYSESKFIQKVTPEHVDFILSSRPFVLSAVNVPNYASRTHMQDIVKDIPVAHVKWLGKLLEPLSDEQIRDCFRAAGYSPEEVEAYAATVKERIKRFEPALAMNRALTNVICILVALHFCAFPPARTRRRSAKHITTAVKRRVSICAALWRDPGNIASLNLLYGPGGKEHQPSGTFTFVKEDKEGTSPKFEIVDAQGVRWKAKLGEETKSETAATRLVWAAGYFTDEDYYLPEIRVKKMRKLSRGHQFVSARRRGPRRPAGAQA